MPKRYKDWFNQAKSDLVHAKNSLKMEDYNWACFASQQAAKKAVKAVYDFLGGEGWGHVIVKLLKELPKEKIPVSNGLLEKAVHLDRLYIPTRYPNGFESGSSKEFYTKKDAEVAIEYAKDILSFVKTKIC